MAASSLKALGEILWAKREEKCLAIIERALFHLRQSNDWPKAEIDLNRELYFCLLTASRELYPDDEVAPVAECNNQPDPSDEARAKREQKRPDFQWVYLDRYESNPEQSSKQFVVECKRLGLPPRSDWILNMNYTHYGIRRFISPEWAYGKSVRSGAMIGYWQSLEGDELLSEVNEGCTSCTIPNLEHIGSWIVEGTSRLEHTLDRAFEVSPFTLHHLWVDLRS